MSQTPLTDAYLASRCKGENKQSWVEFARELEEKLTDARGIIERMSRYAPSHVYPKAEIDKLSAPK